MNSALTHSPIVIKKTQKSSTELLNIDMRRVVTLILSGGQGTRLHPLTATRCKPAMSFAGNYKLIDFAISNALNSCCQQIYVITQFLSTSLHKHLTNTYRGTDLFSHGFIDILSAEQRPTNSHWFQGTADAVRQNLYYLTEVAADYFLILSGDQLYTMDFRKMISAAVQNNADAVIAALPISLEDTNRLGIMKIDTNGEVKSFAEKPTQKEILDTLKLNASTRKRFGFTEGDKKPYLGSMGIYLFKRKVLIDLLLKDNREDFGKHLLHTLISQGNVFAYIHQGYWEDIGTIKSYYDTNIALTYPNPPFDCYNEEFPFMCTPSKLPSAKISNALINNSIICNGTIFEGEEITHSIIGPRSIIKKGCVIRNSYLMGNDFYFPPTPSERFPEKLQISENCIIQKTIIDKDVYLGKGVCLVNKNNLDHYDSENVLIRDGIIIVPRGASLPDGFHI